MKHRKGESSSHCFRAKRFYCTSGEWFFATRECLQLGPFQNRDDAEVGLLIYLRHVNEGGIYSGQYQSADLETSVQLLANSYMS